MEIEYISFAESSGYGLAAQAYIRSLSMRGAKVKWRPLVQTARGYEEPAACFGDTTLRRLGEQHAATGYFSTPPAAVPDDGGSGVVVHHTVPELWPRFARPGVRNIGCGVWETSRLPGHWPALCESMDRVLVPSAFSASVFEQAHPATDIRVVPHIARPPDADEEEAARFRDRYGIPVDDYVFYSINAWTVRKAPWLTLHAYLQAFDSRDAVTLVFKTDPVGVAGYGARRPQETRVLVDAIVANYPDAPHVCLIDHEIPASNIDALHVAADCYLSLAHAEGWGLGACEAGSAGNPVVATGWGGAMEYLSEANAFPIDYHLDRVRDPRAPRSYSPDQQWAVADLDHAVSVLRQIRDGPDEARARGRRLQTELAERFNSERVGRLFLDALR